MIALPRLLFLLTAGALGQALGAATRGAAAETDRELLAGAITLPEEAPLCAAIAGRAFAPDAACNREQEGEECLYETSVCPAWDIRRKSCELAPYLTTCRCDGSGWRCAFPVCRQCECIYQYVAQGAHCENVQQECRSQTGKVECVCNRNNQWSCE